MIEKDKESDKKNTIWNAAAGVVNAGQAVIVMSIVSRVNGVKDAGIMAIAFSIANLFLTIGNFGIRNYQVANEGKRFSFSEFWYFRLLTTMVMVMLGLFYAFWGTLDGRYTFSKTMTIFFVVLWYSLDAIEDVFSATMQIKGKLFYVSQIFILRWGIVLSTFIICDIVFSDVLISVIVAFMTGVVSAFWPLRVLAIKEKIIISKRELEKVGSIFRVTISLGMVAFLNYFITNTSKYVIDFTMTDEVQAIYGYIAMPIFVIGLLSSFIYIPQITYYAEDWLNKRIKSLCDRVKKQLIMILIIMSVCVLAGYLLGVEVLSILYYEDLSGYRMQLVVLLISGAFLAVSSFLTNILIVINQHKQIMINYLWIAFAGYGITHVLCKKYEMNGVIAGNIATMCILAISLSIIFVNAIHRESRG